MSTTGVSFLHTEKALCHLEDQLKCCICQNFARSPVTLGGCEHLFCSVCCEDYLGKSCPVCDIPAHVKDAERDRQLYNLATLCHRLRRILAGTDTQSENIEGNIESTPDQSILGSVGYTAFDKCTRTNKSRENEAVKRVKKQTDGSSKKRDRELSKNMPNTSKGRKKATPDQTTMTQFYDSDSSGGDVNDENKISNEKKPKKARSKQSQGRKKEKVENQSTMSQFYECDDDDEEEEDCTNEPVKARKRQSDKIQRPDPQEQTTMTQFFEHEEDDDLPLCKLVKHVAGDERSEEGLKSQKRSAGDSVTGRRTRLRHSLGGHEASTELRAMTESGAEPSRHIKRASTTAVKGKRKTRKSMRSATSGIKRDTHLAECSKTPEVNDTPSVSMKKMRRKSTSTTDASRQEGIPLSKNQITSLAAHTLVKGRVASPAIDKRNAKGETALQVAAIKNDVNKVRKLLASGANPNVRDNAGWTPLHEACNHGYVEVATLLLDSGAMINVPGLENDTALHDAINNDRLDCVKLLVSRGASLTVRNMHGQTPQDLAVSESMKEALKTPVEATASDQETQALDVLEYQQACLLGTGLSREEKITLQKAGSQLKVKLAEEVTPEVTHIVTRCNAEGMCPRTIKLLQGILMGKWVVNMEWLAMCLEVGSLVCEEAFEVQGTSLSPNSQAPYKGRMNRKQQLPGLFNGCQFYFHGSFEYAMPSKEELVSLVRAGDGQLLTREPRAGHLDDLTMTVPYHSDPASEIANCCIFVVHENHIKLKPVRTKLMCSVPVSWIMDCASHFKLLPLPAV